jgi:hypothetical protein
VSLFFDPHFSLVPPSSPPSFLGVGLYINLFGGKDIHSLFSLWQQITHINNRRLAFSCLLLVFVFFIVTLSGFWELPIWDSLASPFGHIQQSFIVASSVLLFGKTSARSYS